MPSFNTVLTEDYQSMSHWAADFIVAQVKTNPSLLLCAATGSTPTLTYKLLSQKIYEGLSFNEMQVIKLDEWGGLAMDDLGTCETYLRKYLIGPLGISENRYISFHSFTEDPEMECRRISKILGKIGPIDLCILGLGANGHLGFNEPGPFLNPFPHVAKLSKASLQHSMIRHVTNTLSYGLTLGMANILQSKKILLLVSGQEKRYVLSRLLSEEVSTEFPASLLWLHNDVTCVYDHDAYVEPI